MKAFTVLTLVLAVGAARAQEPPAMPKPTKEHEWLQQLVGEWVTDAETVAAPGQPAVKCKGTETVRSLGGLWVHGELKAEMFGTAMTGLTTLGYDPGSKKYVGTWVCSADNHLWKYEGEVSADGKTLTLLTEGPTPFDPSKTAKMKDVTEVKDKDTRVMTSYIQGPDGKWAPFMTMTAKRKK